MSQADYAIYLTDHTGTAFRENITEAVMSVDASRIINAYGTCSVKLKTGFLTEDYFKRDNRIAIYRALPGRVPSLLFNTLYFLRGYRREYDRGVKFRTLGGVDLNHLLTRRIVAYYSGSAQAKKASAPIDNLIKAFARENFGASATDTTRIMSNVTIGADLSLAPSTTKAVAWRPLLTVMQELAQSSAQVGTYLAFDMWATDETNLRFDTFTQQRGIDRRQGSGNQFILSTLRGNFDNVSIDRDWSEEATRCYAGGQGVESERNIQTATDATRTAASMYGLIEAFADSRQISQTDTVGVLAEAYAEIRDKRPKTIIQGNIIENDGSLYDVHFSWGDYITMSVDELQADCHIDIARLQLGRNGGTFEEKFDIVATLETNDDI